MLKISEKINELTKTQNCNWLQWTWQQITYCQATDISGTGFTIVKVKENVKDDSIRKKIVNTDNNVVFIKVWIFKLHTKLTSVYSYSVSGGS